MVECRLLARPDTEQCKETSGISEGSSMRHIQHEHTYAHSYTDKYDVTAITKHGSLMNTP